MISNGSKLEGSTVAKWPSKVKGREGERCGEKEERESMASKYQNEIFLHNEDGTSVSCDKSGKTMMPEGISTRFLAQLFHSFPDNSQGGELHKGNKVLFMVFFVLSVIPGVFQNALMDSLILHLLKAQALPAIVRDLMTQ